MNFFKTKPNMLQQDFHRGNNPAYDKVAFVAEHYEELVFMYKDILEHLKQGGTGTGGGCTHISKQIESPYGFVQLDKESFKLLGYDLDNPDDIQFLLHNTFVGMEGRYGNAYTDYASSSGMEYRDTYEVNIGELDTILVRDPDLDNLLSNPSMLQEIDRIRISYYDQDNEEVVKEIYKFHNNEAFANKENWLQTLYLKLSRNWVDAVQNKPITIMLKSSEYIDGYGYKDLYKKTSDSVENNPIYIVKIPEKIVTYNNVVLFPVEVSPSYASYPKSFSFKVKYMTKPYLRESVKIYGWGDIITCKKIANSGEEGLSHLSADLPIIEYSPTDMHTFTFTIDPDIKDDC